MKLNLEGYKRENYEGCLAKPSSVLLSDLKNFENLSLKAMREFITNLLNKNTELSDVICLEDIRLNTTGLSRKDFYKIGVNNTGLPLYTVNKNAA